MDNASYFPQYCEPIYVGSLSVHMMPVTSFFVSNARMNVEFHTCGSTLHSGRAMPVEWVGAMHHDACIVLDIILCSVLCNKAIVQCAGCLVCEGVDRRSSFMRDGSYT